MGIIEYIQSTRKEFALLLSISLPILVAQVAQTAMGFVDTVMAGHLSTLDLAAVAIGSSIWLPIFLTIGGILMALTPIVSTLFHQGQPHKILAFFHQGLWLSILLSLCCWWLLRHCQPLLVLLKVEDPLQTQVLRYLDAISWSIPAATLYQLCRAFNEGLARTKVPMLVSLTGLMANIPANYVFMYGKFGIPAMGAVGCAWGTTLVFSLMAIVITVWTALSPQTKPFALFKYPWTIKRHKLSHFLKVGLPIGATICAEVSIFCVIALLVAPLGTLVVASQQIALNLSGLIFMLPLSISMGMTIFISQSLGMGHIALTQRRCIVGLILASMITLCTMTLLLLFRESFVALYTDHNEVATLAVNLMFFAAMFQLADGLQIAAAGALRGYQDTHMTLLIVLGAFWGVALPIGYCLTYVYEYGAVGFWIGLMVGLSLAAILLLWRLIIVSRNAHLKYQEASPQ